MGLFKPAWRSSDPDKRTKWIRGKATDSPEDQIILAELATSDANIHVRWAAAAGIADLDILAQVLADIARNHDVYNHHICLALIKRVSDQRVLAQIAKSHKSDSLTDAAVEKVTDLGILNDLAKNADFWSVRRHAVGKVLRQELLADIAQNDQEAPVRQEAVKRLTIQTALEGIARNDENARVRWKAVERLTVQAALA
ncbi:MAG: hypothetical protein LBK95_18055, partial [Bifidobacteriaceae bacterium]|nr:hypothetical protein [Bifidobacteriaceae bacterium]